MINDDNRRSNRGQFQKGRSGNPGGRPRRAPSTSKSAFDIIIGKTLTISRGGVPREISVEEALQHRTYQEALAGKRMAIREVLRWIVKREQWLSKHLPQNHGRIVTRVIVNDPDNADQALLLLEIAGENPDRTSLTASRTSLLLEPWAVKAALRRRRGTRSLTNREIDDIRRCTRDGETLKLPEGLDE